MYRYLQESGFSHSAFSFGNESNIAGTNIATAGPEVPPGALISFLQKGLQYMEIENSLAEDGAYNDGGAPVSLIRGAARVSGQAPRLKRGDRGEDEEVENADIDAAASDVRVLEGHSSEVFVCSWSPSGTQVASGSGDSSARIWDLSGNDPVVLNHVSARALCASCRLLRCCCCCC